MTNLNMYINLLASLAQRYRIYISGVSAESVDNCEPSAEADLADQIELRRNYYKLEEARQRWNNLEVCIHCGYFLYLNCILKRSLDGRLYTKKETNRVLFRQ